jgi:hypothetical protein
MRTVLALLFLAATLPVLSHAGVFSCSSVQANLVANCGFETGDFTGWTTGGNFEDTGVSNSFYVYAPNSGTYFAYLGPVGSDGTLSQILATIPGVSYTVSWYLGSDGGTPNDFNATWDGTTIFSQSNLPGTDGGYNLYTFNEVASGNSTNLTFGFRNDPGYLALDDVSVSNGGSTPEPGALALMAAGLLGLAFLRKRRQA